MSWARLSLEICCPSHSIYKSRILPARSPGRYSSLASSAGICGFCSEPQLNVDCRNLASMAYINLQLQPPPQKQINRKHRQGRRVGGQKGESGQSNKLKQIIVYTKMDGGQSISFTSFDSYSYPTPNNLTFHEIEPASSQQQLAKDSMIRHFPGKKVHLGQHLEVLVLLQTAEIERLTSSLHEHRVKLKRILNNEKDYNSFKCQADELLQVKDELELKNKKIYQYAESQKGELIDQFKYLQLLQGKYKRALRLIQEAHVAKQQTDLINAQQKEALVAMQGSFEAFKQKSIEEYQQLRQELERSKNEDLSFEVGKFHQEMQRLADKNARQEAKFNAERQRYEGLLEQQRAKVANASRQVQKLRRQLEQSYRAVQQLSSSSKKGEEERQRHFAMMGAQIQRLNTLLKEKAVQLQQLNLKLTQKTDQIDRLKRQSERYINKNSLYEQQLNKQSSQITKLSTNVSSLTTKINEMGLLIQQKNVELKLKDNRLTHQIQNCSQVLSKSEYVFSKEIEQYKTANSNLGKELQRVKREAARMQEGHARKQSELQSRIKEVEASKNEAQALMARQSKKCQELQEKYRQQMSKLSRDAEVLRKKLEQSHQQIRSLEEQHKQQQRQFMGKSNRMYEQKWQELSNKYSESNQKMHRLLQNKQHLEQQVYSLKAALEKSQAERRLAARSKTFDSMVREIQTLCSSALQKDGQIQNLKTVIQQLQKQTKQVRRELTELRQVTVKLINISTANETNRREDNYLMIEEIKKLFLQHSGALEEVKENTHKIAYNYNKHKEFLEQSQAHLMKSKEFQISDLKEKISAIQQQAHSKSELKEIISKIIVITKENTELKVAGNKRTLQKEHLEQELENLKRQLVKNGQVSKASMRDKEELCQRLYSQLEESNSLLFEERQNQMRLQSALLLAEEEKEKLAKEAQSKDSIISQLKGSIKTKEEERTRISQSKIDMERSLSRLKTQLQQSTQERFTLQALLKDKEEQTHILKDKLQRAQQSSKSKESQFQRYRQEITSKLSEKSQQANLQVSKLKNQLNLLISQNSELKEEIIRTGSTILAISAQNQQLQHFQAMYNGQLKDSEDRKRQIEELLERLHEAEMLRHHLESLRMQGEHAKRQLEKSQKMLLSSTERMQILQKEIHRLQAIVNDFKAKNSRLQSSSYEQKLTIERNKISQQKIVVLSEEIDRLQKERMNLIEELNICRLEMSQDSALDRQIKEHHLLLVLLFAEVESLRDQACRKEEELCELRRSSLK